jgi:hypothetical protein
MTMRDEYRTKAAEFEARARIESDRTTRLHFKSLANDYQCLADLADRNEQIYKRRPHKRPAPCGARCCLTDPKAVRLESGLPIQETMPAR